MNNKGADQNVWNCRLVCAFVVSNPEDTGFGGHIDFGVDPVGVSEIPYISVAVCLNSNLHRSQKE